MSEIRREEFDELREKVTELIDAHNTNTRWMQGFRASMNTVLEVPVMRWFMWIREMHIPDYPKKVIRHLYKHDRAPVLRTYYDDDVAPNTRAAIVVERAAPYPLALESGKDE